MLLKKILGNLRNIFHNIIPKQSVGFLNDIRKEELKYIIERFPQNKNIKILEIGAGSGEQARLIREIGYDIIALDIESSYFKSNLVFDVTYYDGRNIPFPNDRFDIVFSSNVLEHISSIQCFQKEIYRVTKNGGMCIHLIPSVSWRIITIVTGILKWWNFPVRHGEHAKNAFDEIKYLTKSFWKEQFVNSRWHIVEITSCNILYSGYSLFDRHIPISVRKFLATLLSGSSNVFVLKKLEDARL
jgi:ubiquinone/menaquinone biosynthesis C-methylase UbiE